MKLSVICQSASPILLSICQCHQSSSWLRPPLSGESFQISSPSFLSPYLNICRESQIYLEISQNKKGATLLIYAQTFFPTILSELFNVYTDSIIIQ